jgi:hypothetical protein
MKDMLTLFQPHGCWQCQGRSVIARLVHKPFRFCPRCEYQMREAQNGWNAWRQTVAGASKQGASNAPDPARPSAPSTSGVASPSVVPPPLEVRNAGVRRSEAVELRD